GIGVRGWDLAVPRMGRTYARITGTSDCSSDLLVDACSACEDSLADGNEMTISPLVVNALGIDCQESLPPAPQMSANSVHSRIDSGVCSATFDGQGTKETNQVIGYRLQRLQRSILFSPPHRLVQIKIIRLLHRQLLARDDLCERHESRSHIQEHCLASAIHLDFVFRENGVFVISVASDPEHEQQIRLHPDSRFPQYRDRSLPRCHQRGKRRDLSDSL